MFIKNDKVEITMNVEDMAYLRITDLKSLKEAVDLFAPDTREIRFDPPQKKEA